MAGGNPNKNIHNHNHNHNHPSSSSHHSNKSQPQSTNNNKPSPSNPQSKPIPIPKPSPNLNPNPRPESFPPPPPAYGFHMLDRRSIVLADGTARSYFALPPDYQDLPPLIPLRPPPPDSWLGFDNNHHWNSLEAASRKRKFAQENTNNNNDEFARQRQQLLQYGNNNNNNNNNNTNTMGVNVNVAGPSSREEGRAGKVMRTGGVSEVDQGKVKSAFLNFVRVLNENGNQKKKYLADGKQGALQCLACGRSSKDFPDVHSLVMHTYNPEKSTPDQVPDHLGLHKALCVLMGWNYMTPPDNSKAYQRLSAEEIAADRDDLIMWPPHVIIRNTTTGKGKDGRNEGLGNKAMDMKLRDFGFTTGKSKSTYGREGHMGTTVVKFAADQSGLKDAMRLADFFEKQKHGRGSWASVQHMFKPGNEDEKDPNFVKLDKNGQKDRILYGYLGTASDLDNVDFDTRRKVTIESKREKANHT